MKRLAIYITGHGFGHARRMYAMLRELMAMRADVELAIRTSAPADIFADLPRTRVTTPVIPLDFGVAEKDAMTILPARSVAETRRMLRRESAIVDAELVELGALSPDALIADIPYLAGIVGAAYCEKINRRIPLIATGNFTWDYMYHRLLGSPAQFTPSVIRMREGYGCFDVFLRLPFSHETDVFQKTVDLPLVANPPRHSRPETLSALGIAPDSGRKRVLLGMRGGMSHELIVAAAGRAPKFDFICTRPVAGDLPDNLQIVDVPAHIDFSDLLVACDACISKLGYGVAADAAVAGCAILWPPRINFFEDALFDPMLARIARHRRIGTAQFLGGQWSAGLDALFKQPVPKPPPPDLARQAAEIFIKHAEI